MSDDNEYIWIKEEVAKIQFELPTKWIRTTMPKETGIPGLLVESPDHTIQFEFVFITRGEPEVVTEEKRMLAELDKHLTDVQVNGPAGNVVLNGLRVFGISGIGRSETIPVQWYTLAYGDGLGHGMLVTMIIQLSKLTEHGPARDRFAKSIQPYEPSGS